ncbi:UDP-N-acetylmuramoyl-L-alanine--D-glutamate ligase [bacterium]|nr:UDP-N-acetylmuramoyl-L-alanine--D-glutamate ligase [bacterium]
MDVAGKRVLVVGIARSGLAALALLKKLGADTRAIDTAAPDDLGDRLVRATELAGEVAAGGWREAWFAAADLVVVSPGVPLSDPIFNIPRGAGIPIAGEAELASWSIEAPILAVTGSNGKSTTVTLAGQALANSGKRVFVGGNIGRALSEMPLAGEAFDAACVELSSFQLEAIDTFHPSAALLTNISPNHEDRYADLASYAAAKRNIFRNMGAGDVAILNAACALTARHITGLPCPVWWFGDEALGGAFVAGGELVVNAGGRDWRFDLAPFRAPGAHNRENLMAAALIAAHGGATREGVEQAIAEFAGLPHRLEFVREVGGVRFVNDSKATSPGAIATALDAIAGARVVLLSGGRSKKADFAPIRDAVAARARAVVTFGEAGPEIARALAGAAAIVECASMDEAIGEAARIAQAGDVVLLAPGCASQDAFRDFEHRGERFGEVVHDL